MSSQHKSKRAKADALPPLTDSSNSSSSERKETKQRSSIKRSSGAPGKSAKTNSRSKNKMSSLTGSSELYFSATDESVELFGESGTTPGGLRQIEEVASSSSRSLLKKKIGRALLLKSQSAGEETKEEISAEDNNNNETKLSSKHHKFKRRQSSQSTASMQKDGCSSTPNLSLSSSPSSSLSFSRDRPGRKQHKQTWKQQKHERKLPQDVETNTSVKNKVARIELNRKQQQEQLDNLASETEERTLETRLKDIVPSSPTKTEEKPKKKKKHREHSDKDLTASSSDLSSSRASDLRSRSSQELSVTTPKKKVKRRSSSSASTTTKTKVRRAPASPGEDLDISPMRRDSDSDGDKIPSPTLVKSMPTNSSRRRSSKTRKHRHYRGENVLSEGEPSLRDQRNSHSHDSSFSKAVVAAAVNDATVHGRAFSSHDVKDKVAFAELSRDPICSKHFRNMGQSFKAKIPPPPPPPTYSPPSSPGKKQKTTITVPASPHRATKVNRVSLSSPSSPQSLKGHSWRDRKPFGNSVRSSVDDSCASVPGETASDAVKNILEESEIYNHELKYKVALLESVFDDVHHAPAEMDNGDDKIVPTKRRGSKKQHKKRQGTLPLQDAGEVMPTITQSKGLSSLDTKDAVDVERGLGGAEGDDDATKGTISTSLMHRRSSTATIKTLVRMFNVKEDGGARRRVCLIGVLIFSIIAIVITIVTGLKATNSATAEYSTLSGPTAPPTSFQQDVLPDYTQSAFENPISPQARAFYWLEHDPDRMSWSAGVARQRFVLATLFYASQGESWKISENWLSYDQSECDWYTHQFTSICDVAQRYHTLSLPNNSLRGTLPEEIELLSALSIVQLQDNELRGTLPSRIWSSWEHLVFMNLYNNKFSGTLSSEIGLLANSRHLNTLSFRTNQFSGSIPSELGLLALEFLSLSDNSFTSTLPADLGSLSNVREIYLYKNNFVGTIPSAIGLLTNLTRLEMHDNNLSGTVPEEICDLVSMGILTTLTVDCDKVQCTCGCDCAASKSLVRKTIFDESEGEK